MALNIFKKPNPEVLILDYKGNRPVLEADDNEAIASLQNHPGFDAVRNRFKVQKSVLEAKLRQRQKSLRDVDILQLGIAWLSYIETECDKSVGKLRPVPVQPNGDELAEFNKIYAAIERVCTSQE